MNGLDWFLIVVALFCLLRGFFRGAVSQVFGIAGALSGFFVAAHFHQPLADHLKQPFPQFSAAPVVSFLVLFFLGWFCVGVVGHWIAKALRKTGLGFLDRLMGGAVGLVKAFVLALILLMVLTLFLTPRNPLLTRSFLAPYVSQITRIIVRTTPEGVQRLFEEKRKQVEDFWRERKSEPRKRPERVRREEKNI